MTEQIWLDVPYDDKDAAKAAGARWDRTARAWYAGPRADLPALARWAPLPPLLPGEDRDFGAGLFVDLVPSSCWFTNVRTCVAPGDWDRLRRMVYGRAGQCCEACGRAPDPAAGLRLEAHERWAFDQASGVQRLRRLICLCSDCHAVTHFGLTAVRGRQEWAMTHLRAVTGLSPTRAAAEVDAAFAIWKWRSARVWSLDLSMLTGAEITLAVPPEAAERPAHAVAGYRTATGQPTGTPRPAPGGGASGHEHECGCSDPYGNSACDGPRVTVTEYDGLFPPWMLTAPDEQIERINFFGPDADQMRDALLELRAEAARAAQPAPAPRPPAPPVTPLMLPPVDRAPDRAPDRARRWPWRRP